MTASESASTFPADRSSEALVGNEPDVPHAGGSGPDPLPGDESTFVWADGRPAMDPSLKNIQPGGGVVMTLELAWGRFRRWWLQTVRPGYVQRSRQTLRGDVSMLPVEPIDSRDLKFYRNQTDATFDQDPGPFAWRNRLPFVREGLAELVVLGGGCLLVAVLLGLLWWPLAIPVLVVMGLVIWFFRDPYRHVPGHPRVVVSPADGKLVQIERVDDPDIGPAIQFGIFLSIFNVHANRASLAGTVLGVRYRPGKMLNALRPESVRENENLDILLSCPAIDGRRIRIRQITGQFARRIVCTARPGRRLARGQMYGMIKLGSRTELLIPDDPSVQIAVRIGDKVRAGSSIFARYEQPSHEKPEAK